KLTSEIGKRLEDNFKNLEDVNRRVGDRLDNAARVVGEVQNRLGKMEEASARIFEIGKGLSSLQEILTSPKLRGSLGELFLGDLLAQVLPTEAFALQHSFQGGEKVDAVIKTAHGMISVDSKFPLENFKRVLSAPSEEEQKSARRLFLQDVKRHIDGIATKYIRPDEGTLDYALMYIPAENVYYEIVLKENGITEKDLLSYAHERKIFPVSPNSFYALLQTIALGWRGMRFAEGVREVLDHLHRLKIEFGKFGDDFKKIGSHLSHARGSYEEADRRLARFGERLENLDQISEEKSPLRVLKESDGS
ncbi:MAG: DNA recombination protein RmuC, partial [Deltaproteobacteria bacterium]|nr:DNA recombination protein RmuC [Deltaproteobacteria bacterium]